MAELQAELLTTLQAELQASSHAAKKPEPPVHTPQHAGGVHARTHAAAKKSITCSSILDVVSAEETSWACATAVTAHGSWTVRYLG